METTHEALPASFGERFVALLIDMILLGAIGFVIGSNVRTPVAGMILGEMIHFAYAGYFYSRRGATPGKLLMGIHVYDDSTHGRPSFLMGGLRDTVGHFLSGILLIGFLIAAFTKDGRALHDYIFNTRVRKNTRPAGMVPPL